MDSNEAKDWHATLGYASLIDGDDPQSFGVSFPTTNKCRSAHPVFIGRHLTLTWLHRPPVGRTTAALPRGHQNDSGTVRPAEALASELTIARDVRLGLAAQPLALYSQPPLLVHSPALYAPQSPFCLCLVAPPPAPAFYSLFLALFASPPFYLPYQEDRRVSFKPTPASCCNNQFAQIPQIRYPMHHPLACRGLRVSQPRGSL